MKFVFIYFVISHFAVDVIQFTFSLITVFAYNINEEYKNIVRNTDKTAKSLTQLKLVP